MLSVPLQYRARVCRARRRSLRLLTPLALAPALLPALLPPPARAASLEISVNQSQQFSLHDHTFAVAKMTPDGVLYLYSSDPLTIVRRAPSGPLSPIFPSGLPVAALGQSLLDDFAVDSLGQFYMPAVWKDASRGFHSGVLVLDADGRYQRTVDFTAPINLPHIAVDKSGNIFALGIDARYYRGLTTDTSVLHRYTPFGVQSKAFSPQAVSMGGPGDAGARAKHDIDRGILFIYGGQLYSVLTESRVLRVFDLEGEPVRQVTFSPPGSGGDYIWHLVPLAGGTYLIHWVHSEAA